MIGVDQMGLTEAITTILSRFSHQDRMSLLNCVYLTGGNTAWDGIVERLTAQLQQHTPAELIHQLHVYRSFEPVVSAWMGAAQYAIDVPWAFVTRAQYEEHGPERIWFVPQFQHFAAANTIPTVWAGAATHDSE